MTHQLDTLFAGVAESLMDFGGADMLLRHNEKTYSDITGGIIIGPNVDTAIQATRGEYSDLLVAQGLVDMSDVRLYVRSAIKPLEGDKIYFGATDSADFGIVTDDPKPTYAVNEVILWDVRVVIGTT